MVFKKMIAVGLSLFAFSVFAQAEIRILKTKVEEKKEHFEIAVETGVMNKMCYMQHQLTSIAHPQQGQEGTIKIEFSVAENTTCLMAFGPYRGLAEISKEILREGTYILVINGAAQSEKINHEGEQQTQLSSLYSADFCARANIRCAPESYYMVDQRNRCGCLKSSDYVTGDICNNPPRFNISCQENTSFSSFKGYNENGEEIKIGCGCYYTR